MSDQARLPCSPPNLHRSEPQGDARKTSAELDFSRGWRPCAEPFSNTWSGYGSPAAPTPFVLDPLGYSGLTLGTIPRLSRTEREVDRGYFGLYCPPHLGATHIGTLG